MTSSHNPPVKLSGASALSDAEWVALHVPRYAATIPAYVTYQAFLKATLAEVCRKAAPLAVVEARAKSIPSFAEKILRKRAFYQNSKDDLPADPLLQITDLCGARVICESASQVHSVCQFIEQAFVIDWRNSEDLSRRLKTSEFGYRSVHYVVHTEPEQLRTAGITTPVPTVLQGFAPGLVGPQAAGIPLKAEIQVRSLLEHASSSLAYDMLYKTELRVPDHIRREYAALAAVLEGADREMDRLLESFRNIRSNFGAWHEPAQVEHEIAFARVLLGLPDNQMSSQEKMPVAVRAAQLALAIGRHEEACAILEPFRDQTDAGVQRVLGRALVEWHWLDSSHNDFATGRERLKQATQLAPKDAETLGLRAECAAREGDDVEARRLFALAVEADGTEPVTLVHYLEFEAAHLGSDLPLKMASPMIRSALSRARRQIESRANLAPAWATVAVAHLFLQEPFKALQALAQLIRLCGDRAMPNGTTTPREHQGAAGHTLQRLHETIRRLRDIREKIPGFDWFERFILLAMATRLADGPARETLTGAASWNRNPEKKGKPHFQSGNPVAFLAGGCEPVLQPLMDVFGKQLNRACARLEMVLVSGGTSWGISGVAGLVARQSEGRIRAIGYLPSNPPRGMKEDTEGFQQCFVSPNSKDFSPMDPLGAWTDLVAAGIKPEQVKLICYAPGEIARAECAIALALGALVGVMVDASLPQNRHFDTTAWEGAANLLLLPKDAMTLRAFLQIDRIPVSNEDRQCFEAAARMTHEEYLASATPRDLSLQPWEKLSPTLRDSNFHHVAYWRKTLSEYGLGIRALTEADKARTPLVIAEALPRLGDRDPIAELAELEHGRWNVERLGFGWRFAGTIDVGAKLSPYLLPWDEIPPEIRKYDLDAVKSLPRKFREVGLEIYRL